VALRPSDNPGRALQDRAEQRAQQLMRERRGWSYSAALNFAMNELTYQQQHVVLDVETTGVKKGENELIQIGARKFGPGGKPGETYQTFVDPGGPIPQDITNLTGISTQMVMGAPSPQQAVSELSQFVGNLPVVGHNVGFDIGFLGMHGFEASTAADTLAASRAAMPQRRSHSLANIAAEQGWGIQQHEAMADVGMTSLLHSQLATMYQGGVPPPSGPPPPANISRSMGPTQRALPPAVHGAAMQLGIDAQQASEIVSSAGGGSIRQQIEAVQQFVYNKIGKPAPFGGSADPMQALSPTQWVQTTESGRAMTRTMTPLPSSFDPAKAQETWDPGQISYPGNKMQLDLERSLGASIWPVRGGAIQTGLEKPEQFPKRIKQAISNYQQIYLKDMEIEEAPWLTGPTSQAPEKGQTLRTAVVFGGFAPEGMSYIKQDLGSAGDFKYHKLPIPAGVVPEDIAPVGTAFTRSQGAQLFKGHTGIKFGDWEEQHVQDIRFEPGAINQPGALHVRMGRGIPLTRGIGYSMHSGKELLVGADVEKMTGRSDIQVVKAGPRDVLGLAFQAYSSMAPAEYERVTGKPRPATWQQAAADEESMAAFDRMASDNATMLQFPDQIISKANLEAFKEGNRIVPGTLEELGGERYRATLEYPAVVMDLFTQFTRGAYEHGQPFVGEGTLRRIRDANPQLYNQMMGEGKQQREWRQQNVQAYTASRGIPGLRQAPDQYTMARDLPWTNITQDATRRAMKISGVDRPEDIPYGAEQAALLQRIPLTHEGRATGALAFESRGKDYFFPHPRHVPAVPGTLGYEERSAYRHRYANLLQEQMRYQETGEEEPYRSALAGTMLASHRLVSSGEFLKRTLGVEPRSLYGGMGAASFANLPEELYMPTEAAARASGIKVGTPEYERFQRNFESGGYQFAASVFREPTTDTAGVLVKGLVKWIGTHPNETLRDARIPVLSAEMGQTLRGDFDKDAYTIAREWGIDLADAQTLKIQMRDFNLSNAQADKAGQRDKQFKEIGKFGTIRSMLDRIGQRTAIPLRDAIGQMSERSSVGRQMGYGYNIQQELEMSAVDPESKAAAELLGSNMYMQGQDFEKWSKELESLVVHRSANLATGGAYNIITGEPSRIPFGRSETGMMLSAIRMGSNLPGLSSREKAAMMTPAGNEGLRAAVEGALESGDIDSIAHLLEGALPGGAQEWGENTLLGRQVLGRAADLGQRKGAKGIRESLAEIGRSLRSVGAVRRSYPFKGRVEALRERMRLGGEPPSPVMQALLPGSEAPLDVSGMTPEEQDAMAIKAASASSGRGQGQTPEETRRFADRQMEWQAEIARGTADPANYPDLFPTKEEYARYAAQRAGAPPRPPDPARSAGSGGMGGGRLPPVTTATPDPSDPRQSGEGDPKKWVVNLNYGAVKIGDFNRAIETMTSRLGDWSEEMDPIVTGGKQFTKAQQQMTEKLISARRTLERADRGEGDFTSAQIQAAQQALATPGMGVLGQAEEQITNRWWGQRMDQGARGRVGRFYERFGSRGMGDASPTERMERGFRSVFSGWELMRLQRMWGLTGGRAFGAMPVAAEAQQGAMQAAMVGQPMGQFGMGDITAGLLETGARQQQFQVQMGTATNQAWGWMPRAMANTGLGTAAGIGLPALGMGAAAGWGAGVLGLGALSTPLGLGVAAGAGIYGGINYLRNRPEEDIDVAAAEQRKRDLTRQIATPQGLERFRPPGWMGGAFGPSVEGYSEEQAERGETILSGELTGLSVPQRMKAIQEAYQYAPQWMEPTAAQGLAQQWMRYDPEATNIREIYEDPRFEAMAARGTDVETYAKMAEGFGMRPSQAFDIYSIMAGVSEQEFGPVSETAQSWMGLGRAAGMKPEDILSRSKPRTQTPGDTRWGDVYNPERLAGPRLERLSGDPMVQQRAQAIEGMMIQRRTAGMEIPFEPPTTEAAVMDIYQGGQMQLGTAGLGLANQFMGMGATPLTAGAGAGAAERYGMMGVRGVSGFMGGDRNIMAMLGQANVQGPFSQVNVGGGMQYNAGPLRQGIEDALAQVMSPEGAQSIRGMMGDIRPLVEPETGMQMGTTRMYEGFADEYQLPRGTDQGAFDKYTQMLVTGGRRDVEREKASLQGDFRTFQQDQQRTQLELRGVSQFGGTFESPYGGTLDTKGTFELTREMRNLSRTFQDYNQEYNQESRQLGYNQFQENWQVRAQRMPIQFQRQREDLAFQGNQAAMGFGWQMEDIQENLRFATGRDRRRLLRQQERAAISFGMGQGQRETQAGRIDQNERWAAEDLERQKRHFEERFRLQDDYQERYRQYTEERRAIEDQLQEIQEFNAQYNLEASTEQLDKSIALNEQLNGIQEAYTAMNQDLEKQVGLQQQIVKNIEYLIAQFADDGRATNAFNGFISHIENSFSRESAEIGLMIDRIYGNDS